MFIILLNLFPYSDELFRLKRNLETSPQPDATSTPPKIQRARTVCNPYAHGVPRKYVACSISGAIAPAKQIHSVIILNIFLSIDNPLALRLLKQRSALTVDYEYMLVVILFSELRPVTAGIEVNAVPVVSWH